MAQRKHQLVGLDIDPAGVAVAQVAVNGHVEVERAAFAALEPGVVRDGEVVDAEALTDVLKALWRDNKGLDRRVRIGIANQKIVGPPRRAPARRGPQGARGGACASRRPTRSRCRSTPRSSTSIRSASPTPARGPRQRVVLVAARRDMVDRLLHVVRDAGLRPEGVDLAAFAMVRALHRPAALAGEPGERPTPSASSSLRSAA